MKEYILKPITTPTTVTLTPNPDKSAVVRNLPPRQPLGEMCFADTGRTEEKDILGLANEVACGQVKYLFAVDGRIKTPIKVFERFEATKVSGLGASFHQPLLAHINLILADEFQELGVTKPVGNCFLQSHVQGLHQTGEPACFDRQAKQSLSESC